MNNINEMQNLTPEEKWKNATIANNFLFYKIMRHNEDICKQLIEILLDIEIDRIEMRGEETIEVDWGAKGIRLDVYARNQTQAFNLEMQTSDTKELPERARYYQGVIDVDSLNSGEKYSQLKDSYIIFICISDIFHKGLAQYTFENICIENKDLSLNDRARKYFFISDNCDTITNEEQKAFLRLLTTNKSSSDFTEKIAHLTEDAKHNLEWKRQYMEWERQRTYDYENGKEAGRTEGLKLGRDEGFRLGRDEERSKIALSMLNRNMPLSEVAAILDTTEEKVMELAKSEA